MVSYRAELRAMEFLEGEGYQVARTVGSKNPIDIIAWSKDCIRLIQIKKTKNKKTPAYIKERNVLSSMNIPSKVKVELWVWQGLRGWNFLPIQ